MEQDNSELATQIYAQQRNAVTVKDARTFPTDNDTSSPTSWAGDTHVETNVLPIGD